MVRGGERLGGQWESHGKEIVLPSKSGKEHHLANLCESKDMGEKNGARRQTVFKEGKRGEYILISALIKGRGVIARRLAVGGKASKDLSKKKKKKSITERIGPRFTKKTASEKSITLQQEERGRKEKVKTPKSVPVQRPKKEIRTG